MTFREQAAIAAMQGILSNPEGMQSMSELAMAQNRNTADLVVEIAWKYALKMVDANTL